MKKKLLFIFIPIIVLLIIPFFKPVIPVVNINYLPQTLSTDIFGATRTNIYTIMKTSSKTGTRIEKKVIPGATIFNSKVLWYNYLVSPNSVYRSNYKLPGADPKTFAILNSTISFDKNNTYSRRNILTGLKLNNPELIDTSHFLFKKDNDLIEFKKMRFYKSMMYYIKDGDKIIGIGKKRKDWINTRNWFKMPIKYSDEFRIYYYGFKPTYYSKTSKEVFFYDKIVDGADSETFEIIGEIKDKIYAKDKSNYYLDGKILTGTKLDEFKKVQGIK